MWEIIVNYVEADQFDGLYHMVEAFTEKNLLLFLNVRDLCRYFGS